MTLSLADKTKIEIALQYLGLRPNSLKGKSKPEWEQTLKDAHHALLRKVHPDRTHDLTDEQAAIVNVAWGDIQTIIKNGIFDTYIQQLNNDTPKQVAQQQGEEEGWKGFTGTQQPSEEPKANNKANPPLKMDAFIKNCELSTEARKKNLVAYKVLNYNRNVQDDMRYLREFRNAYLQKLTESSPQSNSCNSLTQSSHNQKTSLISIILNKILALEENCRHSDQDPYTHTSNLIVDVYAYITASQQNDQVLKNSGIGQSFCKPIDDSREAFNFTNLMAFRRGASGTSFDTRKDDIRAMTDFKEKYKGAPNDLPSESGALVVETIQNLRIRIEQLEKTLKTKDDDTALVALVEAINKYDSDKNFKSGDGFQNTSGWNPIENATDSLLSAIQKYAPTFRPW